MNKNTTRVTAVVGTTMALVIAGTAAVSAAGPRDRDDVRGMGGQQMAGKAGPGGMAGKAGPGGMAGPNDMGGGMRGLGGGMRGLDADVERTERTVQTADGTTIVRTEQGIVDSAAADSLSFSLASGEAVTVVIDADTEVVGLEEEESTDRRGRSRTRMSATELEATELEAGVEVIVRSDSEDDAEFVASRIIVKPAEAEEADEAETEDAEEAEAAEAEAEEEIEDVEETTEDAAATDA